MATSYTKAMESRAKTIVLGILTLATVAGCSGGDDITGGDDTAPPPAADGGLDGGGVIGVGLRWDKGVFAQPLWVDGQPRLLVSNRRADEVSFGVFATEWGDDPQGREQAPRRGARLIEAVVPPHATRTLDAAALLDTAGELLLVGVGDEQLGLMYRPKPPSVTGTLPVISNDDSLAAQVETDFSVLPGTSFEATVTLTRAGQLQLAPYPSPTADVEILTATDASSEDAVVTSRPDGFRVDLPADISETSPARVLLSFSVPLVRGDSLLAFYAGFVCTEPQGVPGCDTGGSLLRFVPSP